MTRYERMDPEGPCASPDGHLLTEVKHFGSLIPVHVFCIRCHKEGAVVVLEEDER